MLTTTYATVLDQVRGINWPARRRSRNTLAGPHPSRLLGSSAEFVEYRGYRQGDDPKRIDWKLLARTNRVYIRLSQERTLVPTMLVVDASASMAFPHPSLAKWALVQHVAVGLAAVARHAGDPVGLVVAHGTSAGGIDGHRRGDGRTIAPSTRRSVLEEIMRALDVVPAGQPSVVDMLRHALRRGARVVVVSDFLDEAEALLAMGRTFVAGGGELYAVHIVDRGELDPDPSTRLVEDPEAAAVRRPMSSAARATYLDRFGAWRAELARQWRQAGALYTMLVTGEEPFRHAIRRITARAPIAGVVGAAR